FAARQPGQHRRVVRRVIEVLSSAPMPEAVDERRQDEDIKDGMRERRDESRANAQRNTQYRDAQTGADEAPREHGSIQSVFGEVRRELPDRVGVPCFSLIVISVQELDAPQAEQSRAMGIAFPVGEGVMLSMDCYPFLAPLARRKP